MASENKRIAKNTVFLYIRSFLMMAINLYASRIILQALGVDDYGLYGAIGSMVAMFTIINGSLSSGTSRFLTFELGRGDEVKLKKTFNASLAMHTGMALFLLVLMETIGLWFVNFKMNIPAGREFAANVVYQMSILTCMFSLTQVPYSASIISHEKMDIYAYVGLAEAVFKLALVYALVHLPFSDNLIAYSIIIAAWSAGLQLFYRFYCYKRFKETHLSFCKERKVYTEMLSYSLWDTVGAFCATGNSQGVNILINLFFGVTMNASRAIAYQVQMGISQLSNNLITASNPQIVKSFAQKDYKKFFQLIYETGKFSYYLLCLFVIPLCFETKYVLSLWLVDVPPMTILFVRCALLITLFRILVRPAINGVHATGNVKILNLTSGLVSACTYLPLLYILYELGAPVWACYWVEGILYCFVCTYLEVRSLYINIKFDRIDFFIKVFLRPISLSLLSVVLTIIPFYFLSEGFIRLICTSTTCISTLLVIIYYIELSGVKREKVKMLLKEKIEKIKC